MKLFFVLPEATIQSRKVSNIESSFHVFRSVVREAAATAVLSCIDLFAVAFTMLGEHLGLGNLFFVFLCLSRSPLSILSAHIVKHYTTLLSINSLSCRTGLEERENATADKQDKVNELVNFFPVYDV